MCPLSSMCVLPCRFAFGFLVFVMAYVCWLLVKYYQSYVILRQHYLMGGEKQINEWHQQFLDSQKAEESDKPPSRARSRRTLLSDINRVFNPNIQVDGQPLGHLLYHYCSLSTVCSTCGYLGLSICACPQVET